MDVTQAPPAVRRGAEADMTLADYLGVVWPYRLFVAGVVIVAVLLAFVLSMLGPRGYESTVTFAATPSKLADNSQVINTAAFRPMVESLTTAADVIRELGLDKPPYNAGPSKFLDLISVNEVRGTNLITVKVTMSDPVLAANIANSVANHAVQTARRVSGTEAGYARDLIKEQVDQAGQRLDAAEAQLRDYRQQAHVEAVRKDIEARLGGPRSPVFSPTIPSSNQITVVSPVFVDARPNQAALEQQKGAQTLDAGTIAAMDHLYAIESELVRRQVERDVAQRTYVDLSQKFQEARLQVIGRSAEFVIIDPAVPADRPVSRQVVRNTAVAAVIGLCFGVACVLLWHAAGRSRRAPVQ